MLQAINSRCYQPATPGILMLPWEMVFQPTYAAYGTLNPIEPWRKVLRSLAPEFEHFFGGHG